MSTDNGEVTPLTISDDSPILAELASMNTNDLLTRLGSMGMRADTDEFKTQTKPVQSGSVFWQAPTTCWIFLSEGETAQFDMSGQQIWKTEEERQQALMQSLLIDELEVSDADRATFTKTLDQTSTAIYKELLRLCAIQLSYDSAANKIRDTMRILLDDPNFILADKQPRATMRDLVDLKMTEVLADTLKLKNPDAVLDARLATLAQFLPRTIDDSKLSGLRALLQMQRPE